MSRIRHESVGEQSAKSKDMEHRFPSPKVDSDQFLRIVSWQESIPAQENPSPTPTSDIAGTVRSWYRSLSRRTLFIGLIVLLAVLFIIAIIITVVVVFVFENHDDHAFTAIVFTMSSSSPPTPTPFPFPVGFVVGTLFRYIPLGEFISYGNNSLSLLNNDTVSKSRVLLDTLNCTSCTVLAADDRCFSATSNICYQSQTIYCCTNCTYGANFCRVKGVLYEFYDQLVETRVFSNADGLQLTVASQITSPSCAVQTHRIAANGTIFSGSIKSCQSPHHQMSPKYAYLSSTTLDPDSAIYTDILTVIDSDGNVQLTNVSSSTALTYLPMRIKVNLDFLQNIKENKVLIQDSVLSIASTVQDGHLLVAILQTSRFYALRYSFNTKCVAVLNSYYQTFLFSGELQNFAWAGDTLMLWYVDRNGVNIVQFQFQWDDRC
ncbi:hypothetical protein OSTOST_20106 [Ostertagia ostertagi]